MLETRTKCGDPIAGRFRTGIAGFDELSRGGLPSGRTSLLSGGPGCGKTVFAIQTLAHAVREHNEPGIFVTFEESANRIRKNAESFGWGICEFDDDALFFVDAQPPQEWVQAGKFDLEGLLAALDARVEQMGASCIVFDALDIVLDLLDNPAEARAQVHRLNAWLMQRNLTALITHKARSSAGHIPLDFMEFAVDCSVHLDKIVVNNVSHRSVQIHKMRGCSFDENPASMVIAADGIRVAGPYNRQPPELASEHIERLGTGIERLDHMLGGGYFRGSGVLITGSPGTAKTTLAGAFIEAACQRNESSLFVSFDSREDELVRNLDSVGIDLRTQIDRGLLTVMAVRAHEGSSETHLLAIQSAMTSLNTRNLVVDPISALVRPGNAPYAHGAAERLVDWAKSRGATVLITSLIVKDKTAMEGTPLQISTMADSWLHLDFAEHSGERNRGISVLKSRGTGHSNQVRELILSDDGIGLADVFTADGEVLMGAMRYQKERARQAELEKRAVETRTRQRQVEAELRNLEASRNAVDAELEALRLERDSIEATKEHEDHIDSTTRAGIGSIRDKDSGAGRDTDDD